MSEANKDGIRTYMRAWETGDVELMASVVAPEFSHTMLGRDEDRAGLLQRVAAVPEAFSDVAYELDELVASSAAGESTTVWAF